MAAPKAELVVVVDAADAVVCGAVEGGALMMGVTRPAAELVEIARQLQRVAAHSCSSYDYPPRKYGVYLVRIGAAAVVGAVDVGEDPSSSCYFFLRRPWVM